MKEEKVENESNIVSQNELKNIEKEIVNKTELPEEENYKINRKLFENIFIANIIMLFLYFINLGALNIESEVFLTDLRVFSIILIGTTIVLFELSYRKDNFNLFLHGIECFTLAIFTLFSIYIYSIYFKDFDFIVTMVSLTYAVYYVAKSIIIYIKMRKKYLESVNDISDIIKK